MERSLVTALAGMSDTIPEDGTDLYTHTAPTVPTGWLQAIDEELVCTHLGVANAGDSCEVAKEKLCELINWHVQVAADPLVSGWKLVPTEPTEAMKSAGQVVIERLANDGTARYWTDVYGFSYAAMLNAVPEYKERCKMKLDKLEKLADAEGPTGWSTADELANIFNRHTADFIAAANPAVIKQMIALIRLQHEALKGVDYSVCSYETAFTASEALEAYEEFNNV